MNLAKVNYQLLLSYMIAVLAGAASSSEAIEKVISNKDTANNVRRPLYANEAESSHVQNYGVPFLILLSSDEVCVAQLPLIDNGSVSVAYRLFSGRKQPVEDEHRRKEDGSPSVVAIADAREYEQMPQSTSLGKSEWQQIAGSRKFALDRAREEEVGIAVVPTSDSASTSATQATMPVTNTTRSGRSEDAAEVTAKEGMRFPRGIRSRRGSDLEDGTDGSGSNNSSTNAAPESGPQQNVTSAPFSGSNGGRGSADEEEAREEGTYLASASQEEDDKNSNVRFSDFDVHMALGYAFVADSRGRIHRFRLSGSEKPGEHLNPGKSLMPANEQDYGDAVYANTIDGAARSSVDPVKHQLLSYWSTKSATKNLGRAVNASAVEGETLVTNADESSDDDDANKVGQDGVTHEQSGRHPVVSDSGSGSIYDYADGRTDGQLSGVGTSGANFATNQANKQQRGRINVNSGTGAPKIIWSRVKQSLSYTPATRREPIKGALPTQDAEGNAQMASDRGRQMESAVEGDEKQLSGSVVGQSQRFGNEPANKDNNNHPAQADENEQTSDGNQQQAVVARRAKLLGPHFLRTEIAVDWLNNLLFVLDKYRLLVVDFDGNNELVLIDDFNINNRPIDIKVDPVNDFLFWLQVGNFHNTIYKLDLNVLSTQTFVDRMSYNAMRLSQANNRMFSGGQQTGPASELVALISYHYAHPIITNLPQHAKLFIIDHKHSRIYVPLAPSKSGPDSNNDSDRNRTQRDESVEVFAPTNLSPDESNVVTHMNSTLNQLGDPTAAHYDGFDKNCTYPESSRGQILAFNLDGTDVGPLRDANEREHLTSLDDMQDIALDGDKGYLYWLTNDGRELFEEYKSENDTTFYSAQHNLDGKKYFKLMHFDHGTNQPAHLKPRFNLGKLIHILATSTSSNRWIRSDAVNQHEDAERAPSYDGRRRLGPDSDASRFTRNAPYIILGIFCVVLLSVYLIYSFIFQSSSRHSSCNGTQSRDGSIVGSSISDTNADCEVDTSGGGFLGTSTISRWIGKTPSRSGDTSASKRDSSSNGRTDLYDIESTNYNASNAIDEHYRDSMNVHQGIFNLNTSCLANLNEWPSDLYDMSNKLYVPVEVLQDEALASINRIRIDQLDFERRCPLGEGHFGLVLQGTITCTMDERNSMLNKSLHTTVEGPTSVSGDPKSLLHQQEHRVVITSSISSGHGSSSTSSDFITANSCIEQKTGDYLTPKSTSTMSDYAVEESVSSSKPDGYGGYHNQEDNHMHGQKSPAPHHKTKLRVAIKKLKENASAEDKRDFLKEAKLLANFSHPNIVHLIGICLDRGSTYIVMELMLGGDLTRYMQENTPKLDGSDNLTNDDLIDICLDIANGCCYLERLKYIHRDLAARNCLVSSQKKEERVVKLADFGLARDIYKDSYYKKLNDSAMPLKWMAPECLIEQKFSTMSDIWSFGVVMWEVMSYCQEKPYPNVEPCFMKEHLIGGYRLPRPAHCSDDIFKLMNVCWQLEPRDRPTFQEVRAILIEIKSSRR